MTDIDDISEIKELRRKLGIRQSELAALAGVSQSLVAKIEAGTIEPSFTNVRKIMKAIDSFAEKEELKVEEIMSRKIISLSPSDSAAKAVAIMKKHAISQVPVIDGKNVVGLISEADIILAVTGSKKKDISQISAEELMQNAPPVISIGTGVAVASSLLKFFPMVIVKKKGNVEGVITKADILKSFA